MSITREGQIAITTVGDSHCGTRPEWVSRDSEYVVTVKYKCVVECRPITDARGFLFDQVHIDNWLKGYADNYVIEQSCEELSNTLAELVIKRIGKESPLCKILSLSLTLSPDPYVASVTATYRL